MERNGLADFLRRRRALLQPENVGVTGGGRRRTPGLRRDHGTIVRIPVTKDGGAGRAEVRATGLAGIDDFDFTGRRTEILAAINQAGKLVRVGSNGTQETLLDAEDGMQGTTAVAVRGNRVYVTNGANLAGNDPHLLHAELRRR